MHLHGDVKSITGNLVIVCADTLAANWLGKFKEGVSFAKHNCRHCGIENERMPVIVVERDVALRNVDEHKARCRDLVLLSPVAYQYWSRMWGIDGASCLNEIDGFNCVTGFVQDPMHVLLEGVLLHELTQVSFNFIFVKKLFSLKWLNSAIARFPYSYLHCKVKPEPIEQHQLVGTGRIKQNASAMLTPVHTFPFIVACEVPEMKN